MALRFTDGFDYYTAAQMPRKWDTVVGATFDTAGGRRGTTAARLANGQQYTKVLDAQQTWIVGYNFRWTVGSLFSTPILIALQDGATTQMDVRINGTTGQFQVTRNGTVLATSVGAVPAGDHYIEFKVKIDPTVGTYELRVDGAPVIGPATGQNTRATANSTADRLFMNGTGINAVAGSNCIDDLYICDGTGSTNNDFLGDIRVDAVLPNGAGSNTGMTASTGSNYTCVDESPANDDTDYVSSSVATTKDTYAFADITHTPSTIFGVAVHIIAEKDDAGARSICSVVRSGGTDTDGTSQALGTSYRDYTQIVEKDPNGSIAWTKTNLNAAEFGAKVAA